MDHVEECPSYYVDCWGTVCYCDYSHICICRELLACEERMINAAREAVRNLQHSDDCYYAEGVLCHCEIKRVISTLDALKEKQ